MKKETGEINVCATGPKWEGGWLEMRVLLRMDDGRGGGILALARHMHGSTAYTYMVGTYYYMYEEKKTWISGDRSAQMNGWTNGQAGGRSISCIVTNAKTFFFCRSGLRGRCCQVMASLAIGH